MTEKTKVEIDNIRKCGVHYTKIASDLFEFADELELVDRDKPDEEYFKFFGRVKTEYTIGQLSAEHGESLIGAEIFAALNNLLDTVKD